MGQGLRGGVGEAGEGEQARRRAKEGITVTHNGNVSP